MSEIGFIGVGEIASAVVEGVSTGTAAEDVGNSENGLPFVLSPRNADCARHLADTIGTAEVAESNQDVVDLSDLATAHETPGGLYEVVNSEWMDETSRANLAATLDSVCERVATTD